MRSVTASAVILDTDGNPLGLGQVRGVTGDHGDKRQGGADLQSDDHDGQASCTNFRSKTTSSRTKRMVPNVRPRNPADLVAMNTAP